MTTIPHPTIPSRMVNGRNCPCRLTGAPAACSTLTSDQCRDLRRWGCSCSTTLEPGTEVVTSCGPGAVVETHWYAKISAMVVSVEIPREALDRPASEPKPYCVAICPGDQWVADHGGEQHVQAWYRIGEVHRPECWKFAWWPLAAN
jgi:hypothetical protein